MQLRNAVQGRRSWVHRALGATVLLASACSSDASPPPEVKDLEVDGHRVVYEVRGEGEPTLVFVHGGVNNRGVWDQAMTAFARDHRVVAIDLPGHGESEDRPRYFPENFSEAVVAVLDAAEIGQAVLVAHSFGVSFARDAAITRPSRVAGLYMIDGFVVPLAGGDPEVIEPLLAGFRSEAWPQAAAAFVDQFMVTDATPPHVAARVRDMMLAGSREIWLAVLTIATSPEIARDDVVDVPTSAWFLPGPTLPATYEDYLRERFPQLLFQTAEAGTGHFLMLERPAAFEMSLRLLIETIENQTDH